MDTTLFLARMWGPAIFAIGLGIFLSRDYYVKIYRDLQKEPLAILVMGIFGIAAGVAQISFHNTWGAVPQTIISLLGWGLFLKGLIFSLAPGVVDEIGNWEAKSNLIPLFGALMIALGLYLSWFAYIA